MKLKWLDPDMTHPATDVALVMIEDASGLRGLGEIAPEREPPDHRAAELLRACAVRLEREDSRQINVVLDAAAEVTARDPNFGPGVLSALDMALHDFNGRRRGIPVHAVLGGARRLEIGVTRTADRADIESGTVAGDQRIRLVCRTGLPPGSERWVAAALDRIPPGVQVDIDAAGAFDNPALARTFVEGVLASRARLNMGLLQPLSEVDLLGHAVLRSTLPLPVILDGSLRSSALMAQIVRLGSADRVIANVDRLGGLREAVRSASLAEAAAVGIQAAGFARTAIGAAAVLHLAATLHDTFPVELGCLAGSAGSPAIWGFSIGNGTTRLGSEPGLGVSIADDLARSFHPLN